MTDKTTTTDPDDYRDLAMTALPFSDIHGPIAGTLADYGAAPSAAQQDALTDERDFSKALMDLLKEMHEAPTMAAGYELLADFTEHAGLGTPVALQPAQDDTPALEFGYTNWRGEFSWRRVQPIRLYHGSTEWHQEPQWLLEATDLDKGETRAFAVKDMALGAQPAQDMTETADHSKEWRLWWQGSGQRGSHIMWSRPGGLGFGDEVAFLGDQHHDAADELVRAHNEALSSSRAAQPVGEVVEKPVPPEHTEHDDCNCQERGEAIGWNACLAALRSGEGR